MQISHPGGEASVGADLSAHRNPITYPDLFVHPHYRPKGRSKILGLFLKPHYRSPSCSQPYSPVEDKRTSTPQLPAEHKSLPPFKTSKCATLWLIVSV